MIPFEGVYRLQALRCKQQHVGNRTANFEKILVKRRGCGKKIRDAYIYILPLQKQLKN